jgi:hypothetical protein
MSDDEPLVTVATFVSLPAAELARGVLDAEGIRSFVADGETVNMAWYFSGAVGGVKLQVAKSDFLAAERMLNSRPGSSALGNLDDYGLAKSTAITTDPGIVRDDVAEPQEEDASEEVNKAEAMVRSALLAAVLGLLICPPLGQLYSLWLLWCVNEQRDPLRAGYPKMYWSVLVLDIVIVLGVMAIVANFPLFLELGNPRPRR